MSTTLAEAVDDLKIGRDGTELVAAFQARSRLDAKLTEAVRDFDDWGMWDCDGATSMVAWLKIYAGLSGGQAHTYVTMGRKLRTLPVTASAFADGTLSRGQAEAVCANVDSHTIDLFAEHEPAVVPTLVGLSVADTVIAMQEWKERAHAILHPDPQPEPEPANDLHHSQTLGGQWATTGTFGPEAGDVVATALRLATSKDVEGEPRRSPGQRRADALVDLCRFFLDHQDVVPTSRNRAHLNVVVNIPHGEQQSGGEFIDGRRLSQEFVDQLVCDSTFHRLLLEGESVVLDYGTGTRTVTPALWNALLVHDRHCRFPGCDRPPQWCEAHHGIFASDFGPTAPENLAMFCSRHHHLLHKPPWKVTIERDGTVHVTFPDGTVRTTPPPGRLC